jgi:hypothetical protein
VGLAEWPRRRDPLSCAGPEAGHHRRVPAQQTVNLVTFLETIQFRRERHALVTMPTISAMVPAISASSAVRPSWRQRCTLGDLDYENSSRQVEQRMLMVSASGLGEARPADD